MGRHMLAKELVVQGLLKICVNTINITLQLILWLILCL